MWIWEVKSSWKKIKFLIWCVCHRSIPTLYAFQKKNTYQSLCCFRFLLYEETIFHCTRDYSTAKKVWHSLGFTDINFFSKLNLEDWIRTSSTSPSTCLFLAGVWWNWRTCNFVYVGKETIFLFQVLEETRTLASIMEICFDFQTIISRQLILDGCLGIQVLFCS